VTPPGRCGWPAGRLRGAGAVCADDCLLTGRVSCAVRVSGDAEAGEQPDGGPLPHFRGLLDGQGAWRYALPQPALWSRSLVSHVLCPRFGRVDDLGRTRSVPRPSACPAREPRAASITATGRTLAPRRAGARYRQYAITGCFLGLGFRV
jgi:hypothetical protein